MQRPIDVTQFSELLDKRLGVHFDRARSLFESYGPALSFDVTNVLMHAADQSKGEAVLEALETHWNEHLQFQHPEIRGQVSGLSGNPTALAFHTICTGMLGLQPSPA
mgnify:CR=1 FL=1